jgi:hypothetical protein
VPGALSLLLLQAYASLYVDYALVDLAEVDAVVGGQVARVSTWLMLLLLLMLLLVVVMGLGLKVVVGWEMN